MASSGPTVSFEVGKQAALYNGLATWLYSTSPEASPRVMAPRPYTPTQHQRLPSVSSTGGPPPSGYGRMVNGSLPHSQHGRSLSHTSLEYGSGQPNYQNMGFQRPPSVHGTTDFQRATPQMNQAYGSRTGNGYTRQLSGQSASSQPSFSQPQQFHQSAPAQPLHQSAPSQQSNFHHPAPAQPYVPSQPYQNVHQSGHQPAQGFHQSAPIQQSNFNQSASSQQQPNFHQSVPAPSFHQSAPAQSFHQSAPSQQSTLHQSAPSSAYVNQSAPMVRSYEGRGSLTSLRHQPPPSPRLMSQSMDRNATPNGIFRAPASPLATLNYANLPVIRREERGEVEETRVERREERGEERGGVEASLPRRSPVPDYPREESPLPPPPVEPYQPVGNGREVPLPVDREEKEQLEARMNLEVIRLMEEEVGRLEAKEFLSEAEERRYRAIKYDLAYKRRLLEDDDEDEEDPRLGGMEEMKRLENQVERSLRIEEAKPAPPQKRIPPAVPPKKKTVQFQPPPSSTGSSASISPRDDRDSTPPVDYSRRYVYEKPETEAPRAQVIGAQEVYRDPRQQRLAKLGNAPASQVDGSNLNFRDKMRLFAAQLGENSTPKQGAKSSKAQREIEDTILTPQSHSH